MENKAIKTEKKPKEVSFVLLVATTMAFMLKKKRRGYTVHFYFLSLKQHVFHSLLAALKLENPPVSHNAWICKALYE